MFGISHYQPKFRAHFGQAMAKKLLGRFRPLPQVRPLSQFRPIYSTGEAEEHTVLSSGAHQWRKAGKLHRGDDLPAIIYADGSQRWYRDGEMHRDNDRPARIDADGTQWWYQDGKLHREHDLPAVIRANGDRAGRQPAAFCWGVVSTVTVIKAAIWFGHYEWFDVVLGFSVGYLLCNWRATGV